MLIRLLPGIGSQAKSHVTGLLDRLQRDLVPRYKWDGSVCIPSNSASGQNAAATAIWSSILQRWLPTLEYALL